MFKCSFSKIILILLFNSVIFKIMLIFWILSESFEDLNFLVLQVEAGEKKKKKTGRAKRRIQYNRR